MTIQSVNEWIKETGSFHDFNTLNATFWKRVDKTGPCWLWLGSTHRQGYGFFKVGGKNKLAHRLAFMLANERVPDPDKKLLHSCDITGCVNPAHLSEGTQHDNVMDMVNKGRHVGAGKLTVEQIQAIRNDPRTQIEIEEEYGLARGSVSRIKAGVSYSNVKGETKLTFDLLQLGIRRETDELIKAGILAPEATCTNCGSTYLVKPHHADYSKVSEVNWWCRPCRERWIRRHSFELCTFGLTESDTIIEQTMAKYLYHFKMLVRSDIKVYIGVAYKPSRPQRGTQDALA